MPEASRVLAKTEQKGPPYRSPGKRVNLTAEFAEIRQGLTDPDYAPQLEHLRPEKKRKWDADKAERNALGAYFINRALERSKREAPLRPPYGLLEPIEADKPDGPMQAMGPIKGRSFFTRSTDISYKMTGTVRHDLAADLADVRTRDASDFSRRVLERLEVMTAPVWGGTGPRVESDPAHYFIRRGLGTAAEVMQHTANTIYAKHIRNTNRPPDPAWFRTTMRNSYRLLVKLAGGHQNINLGIIEDLKSIANEENGIANSFDLSMVEFQPVEGSEGNELAVNEDIWDLLVMRNTKDLQSVTTKCPGLVPAVAVLNPSERSGVPDYGSAVQGVWNWYADLLSDAYAKIPEVTPLDKIMALKD